MPVDLNHTIVYCRDKGHRQGFSPRSWACRRPPASARSRWCNSRTGSRWTSWRRARCIPSTTPSWSGRTSSTRSTSVSSSGRPYWADPAQRHAQEVNTKTVDVGFYWEDRDGHLLEIITVPYGGWSDPGLDQSLRGVRAAQPGRASTRDIRQRLKPCSEKCATGSTPVSRSETSR